MRFSASPPSSSTEWPKERHGEDELAIGVRPEAVLVAHQPTDGYFPAEAHIIERLGPYDIVDLKFGTQLFRARTASGYVEKAGDAVWARLDEKQTHFFSTAPANRCGSGCERPWPTSSCATSPRSSAATRRSTTSTWTSATASSLSCSGPTGAGKTTTLRLIAGLDAPNSGSILIAGEDVGQWSAAERDVALVFQYYSLYPHYTVRQNLEFPLKSRHRRLGAEEVAARVARAAQTLRIEHLLERKTDRLSGGEMQRVSIGRAIVRQPRVFLMDEPLSNLDAKLREILRAELKDLQMKFRATFLYVTHDQVEAMSMGDRIGVLNHGRIVQIGTPHEIYNQPARYIRRHLRRLAGHEPAVRRVAATAR